MILRTLLCFFILLSIFCVSLQFLAPNVRVSQHQWQTNSIKAQSFIYNSDTCNNVIVGSSLAARINVDGYCNLSFSGLSIFDGLRIASQTENSAKTIYIETNFILRNEDEDFTGQLTNPFLYHLKKWIPTLQDGKQPLALLAAATYKLFKRMKKGDEISASKEIFVDEALFNKMLDNQIDQYSKIPAPNDVNYSINKLNYFIKLLEKKGSNVIFFEMPVNEKLCASPKSISIRKSLYRNFPPNKYHYIKQPNCANYHTTDGVHLSDQEAVQYVKYFCDKTKYGLTTKLPSF